jgi:putative endonuclease
MSFVYVLWSESLKKRYIGSCEDLPQRLIQHNKGQSKFTKGGIPWKLIYSEELENTSQARKRELFMKSGAGRKWLDEMLSNK